MTMSMADLQEVENLEIELLLEGIRRRYGYDLKDYDRDFVRERVRFRLRKERLLTASQLLERILRRPESLGSFLEPGDAEAGPALFRPVRVWRALRQKVLPFLRTFPSVRAWATGSSSSADLASLLILGDEELSRSLVVYSTDLGDRRDRQGRFGIYRASQLPGLDRNYRAAGGPRRLADHLEEEKGRSVLKAALKHRVVFASHNFATDASFNAFHLILARNALSTFSPSLQARSLRLIHESLVLFGFLVLGAGESPEGTPHAGAYRAVLRSAGIFQKISE